MVIRLRLDGAPGHSRRHSDPPRPRTRRKWEQGPVSQDVSLLAQRQLLFLLRGNAVAREKTTFFGSSKMDEFEEQPPTMTTVGACKLASASSIQEVQTFMFLFVPFPSFTHLDTRFFPHSPNPRSQPSFPPSHLINLISSTLSSTCTSRDHVECACSTPLLFFFKFLSSYTSLSAAWCCCRHHLTKPFLKSPWRTLQTEAALLWKVLICHHGTACSKLCKLANHQNLRYDIQF